MEDRHSYLVGKSFEELSFEEMVISQGGADTAAWTPIASSAGCVATVTVSSGWCGAGIIVSTVVYSVMQC
ncbi:mersacidin family lantibiotic [Paenibacillus albidus]|uniref:mersacidin family lantibiotic n=1 Tax=Paenibacillus albidus TaxID=2041023 RepID=UPI001BEC8CCF|nr:mersacidin family lantibiotic [Paenibacillus albidus]MBT2289555.1 mersacidin family lantibiotic [Paenibacillus albidus]